MTERTQAVTPEQVQEFVIAGHGDLPKLKAMLAEHPALLNARHQWETNSFETALQAAAHVGNAEAAEFLLAQGAPLDICTAAMLGRIDAVQRFLAEDPSAMRATGAHGIPLMTHAAFSGNVQLAQLLFDRGVRSGMSAALFNAVSRRHLPLVQWLLEHGRPDVTWKNFQGKTAPDIAAERGYDEIVSLLRARADE